MAAPLTDDLLPMGVILNIETPTPNFIQLKKVGDYTLYRSGPIRLIGDALLKDDERFLPNALFQIFSWHHAIISSDVRSSN
ncbi:hypothetical protein CBI45_00100 [Corynebacterium kefirresidentii]|nr:hypothetical protein CBI45_00100 [Corynebacterium kefirresidentii]